MSEELKGRELGWMMKLRKEPIMCFFRKVNMILRLRVLNVDVSKEVTRLRHAQGQN